MNAVVKKVLRIQQAARKSGFDWPDAHAVIDKVKEELDELSQALRLKDKAAIQDEFGDVLLVVSNLSLHLALGMEACLSQALEKFNRRYQEMLRQSYNKTIDFESLTLEEKECLWCDAKKVVG